MNVRTLDLFHGAGGSSIGAQTAGATIVAGIDNWNIATECYRSNFPGALAINADIRGISPVDLHERIGDIDLIIASPECKSHSRAKGNAERSEESRLTALEPLRFAREFEPQWLVIENVTDMQAWPGYSRLIAGLENIGYHVRESTLNSLHFGVPQSRQRLFIVCSLSGMPRTITAPDCEIVPAREIIDRDGKYPFRPLYSPHRAARTIAKVERAMSALGKDEEFLIAYYGAEANRGWKTLDLPLRTVTTRNRFAIIVPSPNGPMMRMLQPEELKLAMGFPASFVLGLWPKSDQIKLIGNAVCPPVMEHVVRSLVSLPSPA